MKKIVLCVFIALMATTVSSCSSASGKDDIRDLPTPVDYGNGVYYFNQSEENFGATLSRFIEAHPTLEITFIVSNTNDQGTKGYYITCKPK